MTHVTCRLTAKNRDQLRNPTLRNRVWATFTFLPFTFGYSRPILVAVRSLSLKPISFGYKTPPTRFSQAGGQSAHKARPPHNLELALTSPLTARPTAAAAAAAVIS